MKRPMLIAFFVLLVAAGLGLLYLLVDRSVTIEYQSSELAHQERLNELLMSFMVEVPRNARIEQVEAIVKSRHPDVIVKRGTNRLEVGELILEFSGDSLTKVTKM